MSTENYYNQGNLYPFVPQMPQHMMSYGGYAGLPMQMPMQQQQEFSKKKPTNDDCVPVRGGKDKKAPRITTKEVGEEVISILLEAPKPSEFKNGNGDNHVTRSCKIPLSNLGKDDNAYIESIKNIYASNGSDSVVNIKFNNLPTNAQSYTLELGIENREKGELTPMPNDTSACLIVPHQFNGMMCETVKREKSLKDVTQRVAHVLNIMKRVTGREDQTRALGFVENTSEDENRRTHKRGVFVTKTGRDVVEAIKELRDDIVRKYPQHEKTIDDLLEKKDGFFGVSEEFIANITKALNSISKKYNLTKNVELKITFRNPGTQSSQPTETKKPFSPQQSQQSTQKLLLKFQVCYQACEASRE